MRHRWLTSVVLTFLSACALEHLGAVDAGGSDGAPRLDANTSHCGTDVPPIVTGSCSSESADQCFPWAQQVAGPLYLAVSACAGGGRACARGDRCRPDGSCTCGSAPACSPGEICGILRTEPTDAPLRCICPAH